MASNFKSYVTSGIGLTESTVYAAAYTTTIIGFSLANLKETAITVSAKLYKSDGDSSFIIKNAPVPVGSTMIAVGSEQKVVLEVGDSIKASANTVGSVDAIVSTLEFS